jgi:hypothetical protein
VKEGEESTGVSAVCPPPTDVVVVVVVVCCCFCARVVLSILKRRKAEKDGKRKEKRALCGDAPTNVCRTVLIHTY